MPQFGMTGKVLAKVDREVDPYTHIDRVREAVFDQAEDIANLKRRLKLLENAQIERVTETGVWRIVKSKLDAEAVGWAKWATRAMLAGLGTAALSLLGLLIHYAWKGLHST